MIRWKITSCRSDSDFELLPIWDVPGWWRYCWGIARVVDYEAFTLLFLIESQVNAWRQSHWEYLVIIDVSPYTEEINSCLQLAIGIRSTPAYIVRIKEVERDVSDLSLTLAFSFRDAFIPPARGSSIKAHTTGVICRLPFVVGLAAFLTFAFGWS
jgi:hypothetical protein